MFELELRDVDFCEGRKTGVPGEIPSKKGRKSTTNTTPSPGIEYGPQL
jgi:hypothetical protein